MKIGIYREFFRIKNPADEKDLFFDTLVETNQDFKFFVDWAKVKANVEKFKLEINILNSLKA